MAKARELAALLIENSPASLHSPPSACLPITPALNSDAQIEAAVRENAAIRNTADFREGVSSFLEKAQAALEWKMSGDNHAAVNETRIRVRYAETDQMGVVYHSNHFIWFEVGRVELLRQMGLSYKDLESKDNRFIAVAEGATCRYRAPRCVMTKKCWCARG